MLPGTEADGEQVKCWGSRMHSIRVGDTVPPITSVEVKGSCPDEEYIETDHRDYVIIMRTGGCIVIRDCKLQGYYLEAELVPGEPLVQELPMFDKWGEIWEDGALNCGILGEPYFYMEAAVVRTINALARARPSPVTDQDGEDFL